jgi:hypothetical protein
MVATTAATSQAEPEREPQKATAPPREKKAGDVASKGTVFACRWAFGSGGRDVEGQGPTGTVCRALTPLGAAQAVPVSPGVAFRTQAKPGPASEPA